MGLGIPRFGRGCTQTGPSYDSTIKVPNPDPKRFEVIRKRRSDFNESGIVELRYLDCTNYEGRKILVFASYKEMEKELKKKDLDPHFRKGSGPVARLEPTERGWELAEIIAANLDLVKP